MGRCHCLPDSLLGIIGGTLAIALLLALLIGLKRNRVEKHELLSPNEGIWRSFKNALLVMLVFGLAEGILTGLFSGLVGGGSHRANFRTERWVILWIRSFSSTLYSPLLALV